MNRRQIAAGFAVVVGVLVLGMWTVLLATGQVPELRTAPLEIGVHLLAEVLTATFLIGSGIAVSRRTARSTTALAFAMGMLLYTVVNSAGYYANAGEWSMVGMFGVLAVLTGTIGWLTVTGRLDSRSGTRPGQRDSENAG